jgi:hypothetical protein
MILLGIFNLRRAFKTDKKILRLKYSNSSYFKKTANGPFSLN